MSKPPLQPSHVCVTIARRSACYAGAALLLLLTQQLPVAVAHPYALDVTTTDAEKLPQATDIGRAHEEPEIPAGSPDFWLRLFAALVLVLLGGLVAGLTLGLMSLDETNLHILSVSGDERQRKYAARIKPIRKNGHWLLVTLLLVNTLINESLPIIMDSIFGGGVTAVLVSTALILIFGEVIPQSVCARHGLMIGAFFAWPVRIMRWILAPLGYPMACFLDWLLGANHGMIYRKAELKELVSMHDASHGGSLTQDEITMIRGVLELNEKMVIDVMTQYPSVYSIDIDSIMDRAKMTEIMRAGHSRVPVYEGNRRNIVGVLLVKSLILLDPDDAVPLRRLKINRIPAVTTKTSLFDILNIFQEGGSHMALVYEAPEVNFGDDNLTISDVRRSMDSMTSTDSQSPQLPGSNTGGHWNVCERLLGVITLEDVIEELIQEEIVDETDVFIDMRQKIKVVGAVRHLSLDKLGVGGKSGMSSVVRSVSRSAGGSATPGPAVGGSTMLATPGVPNSSGMLDPLKPISDSTPLRKYDSIHTTDSGTATATAVPRSEVLRPRPSHRSGPPGYISRERLIPLPSSAATAKTKGVVRKGTAFSSRRRELLHSTEGDDDARPTLVRPVSEYASYPSQDGVSGADGGPPRHNAEWDNSCRSLDDQRAQTLITLGTPPRNGSGDGQGVLSQSPRGNYAFSQSSPSLPTTTTAGDPDLIHIGESTHLPSRVSPTSHGDGVEATSARHSNHGSRANSVHRSQSHHP
ncbi:hypothetical protein IWQ60_002274 [Tieghemiomyces parasiticus]|uniref:CNNM transmembrane domain-containing protein n=1 Tax=Tieghemiomyces parasiticus TaxID=78921 RepID=A0A9W8AHS2_9FUNG|nr:hypothetical protein IWQ60_002274 [Tieghemiomyces parasiticus]